VIDATAGEKYNIWGRLRRRKVVQWGIAYAAGTWGLLQGAQFLAEIFEWPSRALQLGTVAALIGLPVVLVLAWYHGDRGQQRVSGTELAIVTLLFLVGGGLFWRYHNASEASGGTTTPAASASAAPASGPADTRPSIAVLPFENRSKLEDDVFFVDGIHDDILTQLSKISALKVISRTSVERFRDTNLATRDVAQQLGVTRILEGGVQRAGDRVRINVQLIDANSDAHLWAESYDRELTAANIFAIQTELATAIAGALQSSLTTAEQDRVNAIPTQNLQAWQAYQLGKQRMATRTSAALGEAEVHFRRALDLDSRFALAWSALADTILLRPFYSGQPMDGAIRNAQQAVDRALALDPDLAEAWAAAGHIAMERLQFDRAEQCLRRAISLSPNYATAHHWLSMTLFELGRREESLAVAERALLLDPYSAAINNWVGETRGAVGRFDEAILAFKRAIEIEPTMLLPYMNIGVVLAYGRGRFDAAVPWFEKSASLDSENPVTLAVVVEAYWHLGNDAEAMRWLSRMLSKGPGTAYSNLVAALVYLQRGDKESALSFAHRAAESDPQALFLLRDDDIRKGDYRTARARYAQAIPEMFAADLPAFSERDVSVALDIARVLQNTGERERARALLDRSETLVRSIPRLGDYGYGFMDVAIYAMRGETSRALESLRESERSGARAYWRYYRDFAPNVDSIRNQPEFKVIFADIERDMARQRAALAARPKDLPLDLGELR
jgi:TolB-like protein/Tfp pilus assembly protein PilF